ncbi:MAG: TonB family protein [Candidatus Eremiobacteraeota bacterium]|nr:TonB family protein [Candidatus Eremiobacteraeota bacterium]
MNHVLVIDERKSPDSAPSIGVGSQIAVLLTAYDSRPITLTLHVLSQGQTYIAPVENLPVRSKPKADGSASGVYLSPPVYLLLPRVMRVDAAWVADATTRDGRTSCPAIPYVNRAAIAGVSPAAPSADDAQIRAAFPNNAAPATPGPPFGQADCAAFFERADRVSAPWTTPPYTGVNGTVITDVTVDAEGNVARAAIFRSSGIVAYDVYALQTAMQAKFKPARLLCTPVVADYAFVVNISR